MKFFLLLLRWVLSIGKGFSMNIYCGLLFIIVKFYQVFVKTMTVTVNAINDIWTHLILKYMYVPVVLNILDY